MQVIEKWHVDSTGAKFPATDKTVPRNHRLAFNRAIANALKKESMFDLFGGIISIEFTRYQVAPSNRS